MKVKRAGMPVILAAGSLALAAGATSAQGLQGSECDFCFQESGEHWFDGQGALCTEEDDNCFVCQPAIGLEPPWIGCHMDIWPGTCAASHSFCERTFGAAEQRLLLDAVANDDAGAIAGILAAHSSELTLNVRRRALQFRNCEGVLIGHVPLEEPLVVAIRAGAHLGLY